MEPASAPSRSEPSAARKRAAVEMIAREDAELRRVARRYSLCAEDAEDAYQRALEILLLKAPSENPRELVRWTRTVIKHEALAIRRSRERLLGPPPRPGREEDDPAALIPARGSGPDERAEASEGIARSREALRHLRPAELRSLGLLAAGYSYAEIGEITGFSRTKVNRCLAEGRERFRRLMARSEDGSRCAEMGPLLSAFCDGEAGAEDEATVREHLHACAGCRATLRAYRSAPATVAALTPVLASSRSLLERAQELFAGLQSRLPGASGAADAGIPQLAAAGGTRGAGMAALAKLLTICAGTAGGAAVCVATGVAPTPLELGPPQQKEPRIERVSEWSLAEPAPTSVEYRPAPPPPPPDPEPKPEPRSVEGSEAGAATTASEAAEVGAVEYAPPPDPPPTPSSSTAAVPSGSAAGEFGP